MSLKLTYNKIAKDWHRDHQQDIWWVECVDKFISFLKPGDLILDIGCGPGLKSKYLIDGGLKVIGIDFSEEMIKIAKRGVPAGEFSVADAGNLIGIRDIFDGIFAQAILLHFPKKSIKDILRCWISKLKPKGYLYIAVKELKPNQKEEEIVREQDYGYPYERFFSYFTREEIKQYLLDLGIKVVYENTPYGEIPWVVIIGQKVI